MSLRIRYDVDSNFDQNVHKVFFQGKRTIVSGTKDENGKISFKKGKNGDQCFSKGYIERVADTQWEETEWLDPEVAKAEEIPILEDCIQAYKDNQKKRKFLEIK
jgi:hypothetical protein